MVLTEDTRVWCALCESEITSGDRAYQEVVGYEQRRAQGGTNALRLRRLTGRVAHAECVARASQGVSPDQEALL